MLLKRQLKGVIGRRMKFQAKLFGYQLAQRVSNNIEPSAHISLRGEGNKKPLSCVKIDTTERLFLFRD
jgi:hypothetical protein